MTKLQKTFLIRAKSRRQYRLLQGKVWKAANEIMSRDLAESVIRTWERSQPDNLPY